MVEPGLHNTAASTIVVIGRNGQLARELADLSWPEDVRPRFLGRGDIDLLDPTTAFARLKTLRPLAIINTAAYTAVDLAEAEPALAAQVNGELPAMLARIVRQLDVPLLHVSTDYVFAGDRDRACHEMDVTAPRSVYGQSKRAGEVAFLDSGARGLILRSAGLFGRHGQNFLKTMLGKALASPTETVRVVDDQISSPTPTAALAAALQQMALHLGNGHALPPVLHFAGQPPVSWFEFTRAIFAACAANGASNLPELMAVPTSAFPRPAPRPAYSALDCSLAAGLGYIAPDWRAALPPLVAQLTKKRIAA